MQQLKALRRKAREAQYKQMLAKGIVFMPHKKVFVVLIGRSILME